jgi:glycosyltransferase involved in cell wall biosynthesis
MSSNTDRFPSAAGLPPGGLVLNGYPLLLRQKGAGAYVARLIHGLRRRTEGGFRVVVPASLRPAIAAEFPEDVFDFLPGRPPVARGVAGDIYWNLTIMRHIARHYPEAVVHAPGEVWAPWRPRRLVVTLYDCIYRHFPRLQGGRLRRWWWRATERYAARADRVLTISRHSERELEAQAGVAAERIRVVYPWVDTFPEEGRRAGEPAEVMARYGLPPDYLLYVGGFNYNKNVDRLIAAYARGAGALPPLVVAGCVPPADVRLAVCDVRGAMAAAGLDDRQVRLIGAVAVEDLAPVMRRARLLIYPSLHEGFGYPPAEALAVGTPVIVADGTSLPEVVRDPVCRFDPTDVGAIAARMIEASAAPDRFRRPLPEEFTERYGIERYLAVLAELAASREDRP